MRRRGGLVFMGVRAARDPPGRRGEGRDACRFVRWCVRGASARAGALLLRPADVGGRGEGDGEQAVGSVRCLESVVFYERPDPKFGRLVGFVDNGTRDLIMELQRWVWVGEILGSRSWFVNGPRVLFGNVKKLYGGLPS